MGLAGHEPATRLFWAVDLDVPVDILPYQSSLAVSPVEFGAGAIWRRVDYSRPIELLRHVLRSLPELDGRMAELD